MTNNLRLSFTTHKRYDSRIETNLLDISAGFYETRVSLEDAQSWTNRITSMEKKFFDETTGYYALRDQTHK